MRELTEEELAFVAGGIGPYRDPMRPPGPNENPVGPDNTRVPGWSGGSEEEQVIVVTGERFMSDDEEDARFRHAMADNKMEWSRIIGNVTNFGGLLETLGAWKFLGGTAATAVGLANWSAGTWAQGKEDKHRAEKEKIELYMRQKGYPVPVW